MDTNSRGLPLSSIVPGFPHANIDAFWGPYDSAESAMVYPVPSGQGLAQGVIPVSARVPGLEFGVKVMNGSQLVRIEKYQITGVQTYRKLILTEDDVDLPQDLAQIFECNDEYQGYDALHAAVQAGKVIVWEKNVVNVIRTNETINGAQSSVYRLSCITYNGNEPWLHIFKVPSTSPNDCTVSHVQLSREDAFLNYNSGTTYQELQSRGQKPVKVNGYIARIVQGDNLYTISYVDGEGVLHIITHTSSDTKTTVTKDLSESVHIDADDTNNVFAIKNINNDTVGTITLSTAANGAAKLTFTDGSNNTFDAVLPNLTFDSQRQMLQYVDAGSVPHDLIKLSNLQIKDVTEDELDEYLTDTLGYTKNNDDGVYYTHDGQQPGEIDYAKGDLILASDGAEQNPGYNLYVCSESEESPSASMSDYTLRFVNLGSINNVSLVADQVAFDNSTNGLNATYVQGAIEEVNLIGNGSPDVDLDIVDGQDFVLARFAGGHIKTKNFDSGWHYLRGKTVAMLGDSITAQQYVPNAISEKQGCTILNYSVGGSTLSSQGNHYSPSLENFVDRWERIKTAIQGGTVVDGLIMLGGVNDYAVGNTIGNIGVVNADTFYGSLHRLAKSQKEVLGSKPIIWLTPMHTNYLQDNLYHDMVITASSYSQVEIEGNYLYQFVNAIKEVAAIYGIMVIDLYGSDANPYTHPEYYADGFHPNATGAEVIAEIVSRQLDSGAVQQNHYGEGTGNSGGDVSVIDTSELDGELDFADKDGNVGLRIKNGVAKTKSMNPAHVYTIAASNSSDADKVRADYVCNGSNDTSIIQSVVNLCTVTSTIRFFDGTYYLKPNVADTDGRYGAIVIPFYARFITLEGINSESLIKMNCKFVLDQSTYEGLDSTKYYSLVRGAKVSNPIGNDIAINNIYFEIYDNQKKITCVDGQYMGHLSMSHTRASVATMSGSYDSSPSHLPNMECVAFRGLQKSQHAYSTWNKCSALSFGIGFAVQGEHLMLSNCGAVACFYGHAFNYFPSSVSGAAYAHGMIVENSLEEACHNLPYFGTNTDLQTLDIRNFHVEWNSYYVNMQGCGNLATESIQGQWRGSVTYQIQLRFQGNMADVKNHVDSAFWADGSGSGMISQNQAQAPAATKAVIATYAPNYWQKMIVTNDNNKMIVCVDPENKTWVTTDGQTYSLT